LQIVASGMLWTVVAVLGVFTVWLWVRKYLIAKELLALEERVTAVPQLQPPTSRNSTRIAVVTGGCGFLGQHVVYALAYGGYYKTIRVFDRMVAIGRFTLPNGVTIEGVVGDVVDGKALVAAFADAESVFHLAALVDTRYGEIVRNRLWHVNVRGTETVIAACQACGVSRLVFTSSFAAVFRQTSPRHGIVWDESNSDFGTDVSSQLFVYGRSKAASELLVKAAQGVNGLNVVILRPNYIIGPGDIASKLIVQSGKPLPLMGPATSRTTTSTLPFSLRVLPLFAAVTCAVYVCSIREECGSLAVKR
jgi:dTDP-4-dehydrorhamnose reductase